MVQSLSIPICFSSSGDLYRPHCDSVRCSTILFSGCDRRQKFNQAIILFIFFKSGPYSGGKDIMQVMVCFRIFQWPLSHSHTEYKRIYFSPVRIFLGHPWLSQPCCIIAPLVVFSCAGINLVTGDANFIFSIIRALRIQSSDCAGSTGQVVWLFVLYWTSCLVTLRRFLWPVRGPVSFNDLWSLSLKWIRPITHAPVPFPSLLLPSATFLCLHFVQFNLTWQLTK